MNCGRCGRPIYDGKPVCDFCLKMVSKDATRHSAKMNRRQEEQEEMFMNIATPGAEEDTRKEMSHQHYVDTHDAASVWVDNDAKKGGSRKRG